MKIRAALIDHIPRSPILENPVFSVSLSTVRTMEVYPNSIRQLEGAFFFIACAENQKWLWILRSDKHAPRAEHFDGSGVNAEGLKTGERLLRCPLNQANATALRSAFPFTRPVPLGLAACNIRS